MSNINILEAFRMSAEASKSYVDSKDSTMEKLGTYVAEEEVAVMNCTLPKACRNLWVKINYIIPTDQGKTTVYVEGMVNGTKRNTLARVVNTTSNAFLFAEAIDRHGIIDTLFASGTDESAYGPAVYYGDRIRDKGTDYNNGSEQFPRTAIDGIKVRVTSGLIGVNTTVEVWGC